MPHEFKILEHLVLKDFSFFYRILYNNLVLLKLGVYSTLVHLRIISCMNFLLFILNKEKIVFILNNFVHEFSSIHSLYHYFFNTSFVSYQKKKKKEKIVFNFNVFFMQIMIDTRLSLIPSLYWSG